MKRHRRQMGLLPSVKVTGNKKQPMQTGEGTKSPVLESSCISFQQGGMIITFLLSVAITALAAINAGKSILFVMTPHLWATSSLMPFIGFLLGYILSALFHLSGECRRTVSMETACQNVQLRSTILNVTFPPEVIGPLFFFPLLYMICQVAEGFLLVAIFQCYEKINSSKDKTKIIYTAATTEEIIPAALENNEECSPCTT